MVLDLPENELSNLPLPEIGPPASHGVDRSRRRQIMPQKRYRREEIITKLREAEVLLAMARRCPRS